MEYEKEDFNKNVNSAFMDKSSLPPLHLCNKGLSDVMVASFTDVGQKMFLFEAKHC